MWKCENGIPSRLLLSLYEISKRRIKTHFHIFTFRSGPFSYARIKEFYQNQTGYKTTNVCSISHATATGLIATEHAKAANHLEHYPDTQSHPCWHFYNPSTQQSAHPSFREKKQVATQYTGNSTRCTQAWNEHVFWRHRRCCKYMR